jgi:uncharacterized delta-60 repeat protein
VCGLAAVLCLLWAASASARPGDLDPGFSTDGIATFGLPKPLSDVTATAVGGDGKIVLAGSTHTGSVGDDELAIERVNADGSPDPSFGTQGQLVLQVGIGGTAADPDTSRAAGLAIQPDGRIVIGVTTGSHEFTLIRLLPDGSYDPSFSGDGIERTSAAGDATVADIARMPDGRIVAAGRASGDNHPSILVVRYLPDGTPDPSFSGDGVAFHLVQTYGSDDPLPTSVAVAPDGSAVVGGSVWDPFADHFVYTGFVTRFDGAGNFDAGFGDAFFGEGPVYDVAVDSVGGIELAGVGSIYRLTPAGDRDASYGHDGGASANLPGFSPLSLITGGDGAVTAAGWVDSRRQPAAADNFVVARFTPAGQPDPGFGNDGSVSSDLPCHRAEAWSLARTPDEGIAVGGGCVHEVRNHPSTVASSDFAVARYLSTTGPDNADADGVPDSADRCPSAYSTRPDGCAKVARDVELTLHRRTVTGALESDDPGCRAGVRVALMRAKPGRDATVSRDRATPKFLLKRPEGSGRYYFAAPRTLVPDAGICSTAIERIPRSRRIQLPSP